MRNIMMGWDIGGAHLKAATIKSPQKISAIYQRPCPLWKGLDKLEEAVRGILNETACTVDTHILTMTGELVDLFENREDGVGRILGAMRRLLPDGRIFVYTGRGGFLDIEAVTSAHANAIASANWMASAAWTAGKIANGLFVDIGSTTTDILLIDQGNVSAEGYTDYERLISNELVYTGIVRTAVMSVAPSAQDGDCEVGLMAEYFATTADVYRLTGELNENHDQTDTADGAGKTIAASARRLARMIGCDYKANELHRWQRFARNIRQQQLNRIRSACEKQLSRAACSDSPLIGAGIGSFLVKELAEKLNRPYLEFSELFGHTAPEGCYTVTECAPAAAVACLAAEKRLSAHY